MGRDIQPRGLRRQAEEAHDASGQGFLVSDRIGARRQGTRPGGFPDGLDQGNDGGAEFMKEGGNGGRGGARLEALEQGVVRFGRIAQGGGLFQGECKQGGQMRGEGREIVVGPGQLPGPLPGAGRPGQFHGEGGGNFDRTVVIAAPTADVGCFGGKGLARQLGIFAGGQPVTDGRILAAAVDDGGLRSELFRPSGVGRRRQHDLLVPIQKAQSRRQFRGDEAVGGQPVIGLPGRHDLLLLRVGRPRPWAALRAASRRS